MSHQSQPPVHSRDWATLVKLKHPGFLAVVEPLEETRTQLVVVTEAVLGPIDAIIGVALGAGGGVRSGQPPPLLSALEIKHGFLQVRLSGRGWAG
jgi:SCY1-like protein 2